MKVIILAFFIVILICTGCGIPEEEHQKVLDELGALQTAYQQLNQEYDSAKASQESIQEELNSWQTKYAELQDDYKAVNSELEERKAITEIEPKNSASREEIFTNSDFWNMRYENNFNLLYERLQNTVDDFEDACIQIPEDCKPSYYHKAIWLYYSLASHQLQSILVLGNLEAEVPIFAYCMDIWLYVFIPPEGGYFAIDPERGKIKFWKDRDGKIIPENQVYYEQLAFLYITPEALLADIAYRWLSIDNNID